MPPRGRPGSSHSSRPASSSSHRPSSSHSSAPSHRSAPSHHRSSPPPPHIHPHHPHMFGAPPPPPPPSRGFRRSGYGYGGGTSSGGCSGCAGVFAVLVILVILSVVVVVVTKRNNQPQRNDPPQSYSQPAGDSHDPIYVPALERKVQWNYEYDSYYDQPTDCYFFLNTDMEPPIWQYWYEGTSSDYGDYGWMEWDAQENRWYIETGETTWIPLPAGQEKPHFWHFD